MTSSIGNYCASFFTEEEQELAKCFLRDGYAIVPTADSELLDAIRAEIVRLAVGHIGCAEPENHGEFLNTIHQHVTPERLNDMRLAVFQGFNGNSWARSAYYAVARNTLDVLVGNELAMQKNINLSIQLPDDRSSLLPVHSDVWSGDSPFEVVVWLPLVDCYKTKSMFILNPEKDREHRAAMHKFEAKGADNFFEKIKPDVVWLDVPFGSVLVFTHTLMHGNIVNNEMESRWSMNCRFKSVLSPYSSKRLGEFFEPINIRPATLFGMNYDWPEGFSE